MKRFSITCLLIVLFTFPFKTHAAQNFAGTISGTVLDSNRAPLPRATVRLLDQNGAAVATTATDDRGRFHFQIAAGTGYKVESALTGFEPAAVAATSDAELEIVMSVVPVRESIVVTATRTEAPTVQVGASTTVIDKSEIADRQALPVSDLLQSVTSAAVVRSGGLGTVTSLYIRGGESNYNKVLLDGIPLNEPGGFLDFSNLMTDNLERIEVVRGPQSALFGSDAMSSVIQLFSARGEAEGRQPHFFVSAEGGGNSTWRTQAGVSGKSGLLDYSLDWSRLSTDNQTPNNSFQNTTASGNFGLALGEKTNVRFILRGDLGRTGTPGQTAFEPPDSDAFYRRGDGFGGIVLRNQTTPFWEQHLTYTFAKTRYDSRNLAGDPDFTPQFEGRSAPFVFSDSPFDSLTNVWRHHVGYQSDFRGGSIDNALGRHTFTFAFDWDRELGLLGNRFPPSPPLIHPQRDNLGWTLQDQVLWKRVSLTNGVRVEDNGSFGISVVPRSSLAYLLREGGTVFGATKLKFNFGLGINEPSFLESFSAPPVQGNPHLAPERVRSFDFGVEQRVWGDRAKVELNWFDNRFRDKIAFQTISFVPFTGSYFNLGRSKAKGAETILSLAPMHGVRINGSYTFLNSEITRSIDPFTDVYAVGRPLLRRPRHSGSIQVYWDWRRLNVSSSAVFVGARSDSDFVSLEPPLIVNPGYVKWDLAWSYRSTYRITYFGIVENLLNQAYMDPLGFPALKLTYRAGIRVGF